MKLTHEEITLLRLLQEDLPLCDEPFEELGRRAGMSGDEVISKIREWKESGVVRRVGLFIRHRKAGFEANGMAVWDVAEEKLDETGARLAEKENISHCYARPRSERWPFRLYTMIHGKTRDEVLAEARAIAESEQIENYRVLFSTRELKKSDTKLFMEDEA